MRELIFVNTETGGLDDKHDPLVEISWSTLTGPINTLYLGVEKVSPVIDTLIKFTERGIAGRVSSSQEWSEFMSAGNDNTMVAANPSFDKSFLVRFGAFPFHYRMLNIESYAFAKLGLEEVPGMANIYDILKAQGHDIPEPNHTSAGDVAAMRASYKILREI